jgi:hypothetical protein
MLQFAIRCHPTVPVPSEELEQWLDLQMDKLRADAPTATVRVSHLSQALPSGDVEIGWLLEFEVPESERLLAHEHLAVTLTDMVLLGFQPTVLAPVDTAAWRIADTGAALAAPSFAGTNGKRS